MHFIFKNLKTTNLCPQSFSDIPYTLCSKLKCIYRILKKIVISSKFPMQTCDDFKVFYRKF